MPMTSFQKKLSKILKEDQDSSPTRVHPEAGEDVTHGVKDGTSKIDATGPIKTGAAATLHTNPGPTTAGPTGHIPTNSDLPRPQLDGLDSENKNPGKKVYGISEEGEDDDKKDTVEEGKLPAFLVKKKDSDSGDDKDKKKEVDEELANGDKKVDEAKDDEFPKSVAEEADDKEDEKADKEAVKEATNALLKGEKLSEVFREKTATIFEATLSLRLRDQRKKLTERFNRKLNDRVEEIREQLTESVNGHLDLVVENWVHANEVPLEKALKAELVEDFIGGLKSLLEEHYFELPAEKVDVVTEMVERLSASDKRLNEQIEVNLRLQRQVKLFERTEVFSKVSKGLVSTQTEKLRSLSEGTEFKTAAQFEAALVILKESIESNQGGSEKKTAPKNLSEQTLEQSVVQSNSSPLSSAVKDSMRRMAQK